MHRLRNSLIPVVAALLLAGSVTAAAAEPSDRVILDPAFLDVPTDHPFAPEVRSIMSAGITRGCNPPVNSLFCPGREVTRAEMAAFLVRVLDLPAGERQFADTTTHPLRNEVATLAVAGITRGCNPPDNTRFCPDSPVTRAQMAAFVDRATDLDGDVGPIFDDIAHSEFATEITRLAAAGVTRGCNPPDNTRFCPDSPITRAEMAAFLHRAFDLPAVPASPSDVSSTLTEHTTDLVLTVSREVCDTGAGGEVTVRHASLGKPSEPTALTLSSGSWNPEDDIWVVDLDEGACARLEITWDPGTISLNRPIEPVTLTSPYGNRFHPIARVWRLHAGIDLRGYVGQPISASADGVVVKAGYFGGYGNMVDVAHPGGLVTRYAHMSRIDTVEGAEVTAGDTLGLVGCTGSCTGPHLHWETRVWDDPIDPNRFADWLVTPSDAFVAPLHDH